MVCYLLQTDRQTLISSSVQAFLYTTYIVLYAALSVVLGHIIDVDEDTNGNIIESLKTVGGLVFIPLSPSIYSSNLCWSQYTLHRVLCCHSCVQLRSRRRILIQSQDSRHGDP